jgi:hypothetical protein
MHYVSVVLDIYAVTMVSGLRRRSFVASFFTNAKLRNMPSGQDAIKKTSPPPPDRS